MIHCSEILTPLIFHFSHSFSLFCIQQYFFSLCALPKKKKSRVCLHIYDYTFQYDNERLKCEFEHIALACCDMYISHDYKRRPPCVIACLRLKERFVEGVWKKCVKCPSTGLIEVKLFFIALFMYFFGDQYFCS